LLAVLVKNAKKGSTAAAIAVLDRGFGKPAQSVDTRMLMEKRIAEMTPRAPARAGLTHQPTVTVMHRGGGLGGAPCCWPRLGPAPWSSRLCNSTR
jgi:hypothetical protein